MGWICPGTDLNPVQKSVFNLRAPEDKEAVEEIWRSGGRGTEMAAIVGLLLRDRRNAKKRKRSRSKNKPMESLSRRLIVNLLWCLAFLLFVLPGAASVAVEGLKGGSVTLPCSLSSREDLSTVLTFGSKIAYGRGQNEHFSGRVHESGSCDLTLQYLKTTDAGKYTSNMYANGQLIDSYTYDVYVKVNLTRRKGKELMFDELPREAESVEHFTDPDWTEVWRRGQGALTDRLIDKNGLLIIKNFSSSDAGTYRVLNSTRGILLTVTVTAFSTDPSTSSNDKQDGKHKDQTHEQVHVGVWIGIGVVALIVFAVIMERWCRNRNKKHDSY